MRCDLPQQKENLVCINFDCNDGICGWKLLLTATT
jgi:hypothetical protein